MTLAQLIEFLEQTDAQGVDWQSPVLVVIDGQPGFYDITHWTVASSLTRTPIFGITRQLAAQEQEYCIGDGQ